MSVCQPWPADLGWNPGNSHYLGSNCLGDAHSFHNNGGQVKDKA
jgi:hypothetical protein